MARKRLKSDGPPRRNMVTPVNVIKLNDLLGGTAAAQRISGSTTMMYKAIKESRINKVYELAAAQALTELANTARPITSAPAQSGNSTRSGEAAFFVTVASDKADMFQRMAVAMGATLVAA